MDDDDDDDDDDDAIVVESFANSCVFVSILLGTQQNQNSSELCGSWFLCLMHVSAIVVNNDYRYDINERFKMK